MIVLSLFDGISCARVALDRLGYTDITYYASEVDKYAMQVSAKNWPDIIQLGDVRGITASMFDEPIDLLIGGSPCQDLSIAKMNRKGLDGDRSGLFWEYVRIWKETNPTYFIFENVNSMPKIARKLISEIFDVEPIMINATKVSAQNRKRLFWTNIETSIIGYCHIPQPEDRRISINSILESGKTESDKSYAISSSYYKSGTSEAGQKYSKEKSQRTLVTEQCGKVRKLTPLECERLQGLPDGYSIGISNTQRYICLGNAFNVEVIKHLLEPIVEKYKEV